MNTMQGVSSLAEARDSLMECWWEDDGPQCMTIFSRSGVDGSWVPEMVLTSGRVAETTLVRGGYVTVVEIETGYPDRFRVLYHLKDGVYDRCEITRG